MGKAIVADAKKDRSRRPDFTQLVLSPAPAKFISILERGESGYFFKPSAEMELVSVSELGGNLADRNI